MMRRRLGTPVLALLVAACLGGAALGQPNVIPGIDVSLGILGTFNDLGRTGTYPNGVSGFAMSTTSCNLGTVNVNWFQAMNADHPFIGFLVARELNGRLEQISDRSYVKHAFYALSNSQCTPCQNPSNGTFLGVGCSDTYSTGNNGDNYWIGPPDEVDPWTGTWNPVGSHFDRGEPPVSGSASTDGARSLTSTMANALLPVGHRVRVNDADLNVPNATFYYQGFYVIRGEAEANRGNNLCSRRFTVSWSGSQWTTSVPSSNNASVYGSILERWTGATVTSNTNGAGDGRVHVAVRVTGPVNGLYHYEYAVHNRDSARAVQAFRIPICAGASFENPGFRDVDAVAGNAWTATRTGEEIVFATDTWLANPAANALRWNMFYNFWFDSDAAPDTASATLDAFAPGAGAPSFTVTTTAPRNLSNLYLGPGCGSPPPSLFATGSPARALLGNSTFGLRCTGLPAGASILLLSGVLDGIWTLGPGCDLYMTGAPLVDILLIPATADPLGVYNLAVPVPSNPVLEGLHANLQVVTPEAGGPLFGGYALSNGLRVRFGSLVPSCP